MSFRNSDRIETIIKFSDDCLLFDCNCFPVSLSSTALANNVLNGALIMLAKIEKQKKTTIDMPIKKTTFISHINHSIHRHCA